MNKNESLKKLLKIKYFYELCEKIGVKYISCKENIFVFNEHFAFILCDLMQDYEVDVLFFDRNKKLYSQSIYSVGSYFVGDNFELSLKNKYSEISKSIDFNILNIANEQKKDSLLLFISFLNEHGISIFSRGVDSEIIFSRVIDSVVNEWEMCMSTLSTCSSQQD